MDTWVLYHVDIVRLIRGRDLGFSLLIPVLAKVILATTPAVLVAAPPQLHQQSATR